MFIPLIIVGLVVIILIVLIVLFVRHIFKMESSTDSSTAIATTGLSIFASSFSGIREFLLAGVFEFFNLKTPSGLVEDDWMSMVCGILLLCLGAWLRRDIKERIFILNMYGLYAQKDISDENNIRDLKLNDLKVKEMIIDFVDGFEPLMNEKSHSMIIKKIDRVCGTFKERSRDRKSCFTGMAPIPYTIYAGTQLADCNICRYFEYERSNAAYYELSHKKRKKFDPICVSYPRDTSQGSKEVLIALSITHRIAASDLEQFAEMDQITISLDYPKDNVIVSNIQLDNYCGKVLDVIEDLKERYPKLCRVYLAASISSCVSLELGKLFSLNRNRIPEIVAVHYMNSETPRYPFGVIVSGTKEVYGNLVPLYVGAINV